jgi:hypothetical protein
MVAQQSESMPSDADGMVTVREISTHWNVSVKTARRWCGLSVFAGAVQVGREWRIPRSSVKNPDTSRIPVGGAPKGRRRSNQKSLGQ